MTKQITRSWATNVRWVAFGMFALLLVAGAIVLPDAFDRGSPIVALLLGAIVGGAIAGYVWFKEEARSQDELRSGGGGVNMVAAIVFAAVVTPFIYFRDLLPYGLEMFVWGLLGAFLFVMAMSLLALTRKWQRMGL